jgi:DNA-binding FrmR family transcriptional regulator
MSEQLSEQTISEIKERLERLEKQVEAIERHINKDICDVLDHIQNIYNSLITHWKKMEAIERYVKQLKQNVISLHEKELSVEDILNMFPSDDQLEPES